MKKKMNYLILLLTIIFMVGCTTVEETSKVEANTNNEKEETVNTVFDEPVGEETPSVPVAEETPTQPNNELFSGYELIEVDGGDLSGYRQPNVVVDIGFGDREYWAFTNEHGQLVRVIADEIILQDDNNEPVTSSGRYYSDEAKVPGVERDDLDEGHIIADSLGGVSNAYNITPQEVRSTDMVIRLIWKTRSVRQVEQKNSKRLSHIQIRKRRFLPVISILIH